MTIDKKNCTTLPLNWYHGFNGTGECHYTTQNFSEAFSPAFIEEGNVRLQMEFFFVNIFNIEQITIGNLVNIQHGRNQLGVN